MAGNPNAPQSEVTLSKRHLGWAGFAAFVTAVVCCGLPMIAVLVGGGAIASLASSIPPGTELIAGVAAGVVALSVKWLRARSKRQRACAAAATFGPSAEGQAPLSGGGCGCVPASQRDTPHRSPGA